MPRALKVFAVSSFVAGLATLIVGLVRGGWQDDVIGLGLVAAGVEPFVRYRIGR